LDPKCKSFEIIKKAEKKKEEKRIKYEKGPGETIWPSSRKPFLNQYTSFRRHSLTVRPHMSSCPPAANHAGDEPTAVISLPHQIH
jgi:hypothetical protein